MFVLHFSSLSAVSAGQVITWRLSYIANITSTKANKEEKKKKKPPEYYLLNGWALARG